MKMVLFLILISQSVWAQEKVLWYVGPQAGGTTINSEIGDSEDKTHFVYGAQSLLMRRGLGLGLRYNQFEKPVEGTSLVSVGQTNQSLLFEARVGLYSESIIPYLSIGAGPLFKTVQTSVMGATESSQQTFFTREVGIGILGLLSKQIALDASVRYFQYTDTNGVIYMASLGFYLPEAFSF